MNPVNAQGRCLCGNVQFKTSAAPLWVGHCHCKSCRRNTGSAAATFVGVADSAIEFIQGEPRIYSSSPGVHRGFCTDCGTPLTYEADRFPGEVHIYLGTFDHPERFTPQFHVYYEERVPWFEISDSLPRYKKTTYEG